MRIGASTIMGTVWVTTRTGYSPCLMMGKQSITMPRSRASIREITIPDRASETVTTAWPPKVSSSEKSVLITCTGDGSTYKGIWKNPTAASQISSRIMMKRAGIIF